MKLRLNQPLSIIKGIGTRKYSYLKNNGFSVLWDLLHLFPRKYENRKQILTLSQCLENEGEAAILCTIVSRQTIRRGRRFQFKIRVWDETGYANLTFFHLHPAQIENFLPGRKLYIFGNYKTIENELDFVHPSIEWYQENMAPKFFGKIIPVYPIKEEWKSAKINSTFIFFCIQQIIQNSDFSSVPEFLSTKYLPADILNHNEHEVIKYSYTEALIKIHCPESDTDIFEAKRRIILSEFFHHLIRLYRKQLKFQTLQKQRKYQIPNNLYNEAIKLLPYKLTLDQISSLEQIQNDLLHFSPMRRLLHGEVGSGKTIVAFLAAIMVIGSNYQALFLVPTEILAQQHYNNFLKYFKKLPISTILLTGNIQKNNSSLYTEISNGSIQIIFGTHSLLNDSLVFQNLSLVIIDEQHKFGVNQRSKLQKKGYYPDLLMLSATPIPRTLALSLYSNMKISQINKRPQTKEKTKTLLFTHSQINGIYKSIRKYLARNQQVYWLHPVVQESEDISFIKSAEENYIHLKNIFPEYKVALLHGSLNHEEKKETIQKFLANQIHILVTTTIIEVGIDNPNATIIVIDNAERFGLAQLHQIRGRVGRGDLPSFCVLLTPEKISESATNRLQAFTKIDNGFELAMIDLKQRGPGDFFGVEQHGVPTFLLADIIKHEELLLLAQKIARQIISNNSFPTEILSKISRVQSIEWLNLQ